MYIRENFVVFPEGDIQEIEAPLPFDALVDLNGRLLEPPLPSTRMIAFRVVKIRRDEARGGEASYHHLELVSAQELGAYLG